jgi:hypothetical protein
MKIKRRWPSPQSSPRTGEEVFGNSIYKAMTERMAATQDLKA